MTKNIVKCLTNDKLAKFLSKDIDTDFKNRIKKEIERRNKKNKPRK